jgi:hypothetical protein
MSDEFSDDDVIFNEQRLAEAKKKLLYNPNGSLTDPKNRRDVEPSPENIYLSKILALVAKNQTGGSLASDHVMRLFQRTCDVPFAPVDKTNFTVPQIVRNYGSNYMISGGGQRGGFSMDDLDAFVRQVADNRVLDLYLKYLGLTLLTPATLVPIALIMGRETFKKVVSDMKANDQMIQSGGKGFLDIGIPIIDDNIVGNGLKLAGLTALAGISPYTLVPVAVLMLIYQQFEQEQGTAAPAAVVEEPAAVQEPVVVEEPAAVGGRRRSKQRGSGISTVLPPEYFGRRSGCRSLRRRQRGGFPGNNLDTPASRAEVFGFGRQPVDNSGISRPYQQGGFPGNNLDTPASRAEVFGFGRQPVDNSGISRPYQQGGSRTPVENTVPPNMVQLGEKLWSGQEVPFPRGTVYVNNEMQLNGTLPRQPQYIPPNSQQLLRPFVATGSSIPNAMAGGRRRKRSQRRQRGGGSDWIGTLYSRGPVNSSDMNAAQFAMFNGSSPMIPNSVLAGGPLPSSSFYNYPSYENTLNYRPLFMENQVSTPASNSGVFPSNFN